MIVVLNAITEILKANRGRNPSKYDADAPPSPVEYFGAIMTTLEADSDNKDHTHQLLYLLSQVLPNVHSAVLRAKFSDVSSFLMVGSFIV